MPPASSARSSVGTSSSATAPTGRCAGRSRGATGRSSTRWARSTGAEVDRIVVDAADSAGLAELAAGTRLVVSTVGPYARYGSPLVAAVAEAGIDYVDLTGEPQWMRRMIDQHQATAERTGARIVHTCGFDSIPSDLGTLYTQQRAVEQLGTHCTRIDLQVRALRGGASGGTIASMVELVTEASSDPTVRKLMADPYGLNPTDLRSGPHDPDVARPTRDADGRWVAPFVMAAVNRKVVHRSHALLGRPWGHDFRYQETIGARPPASSAPPRRPGITAGLGAFVLLLSIGPTRRAARAVAAARSRVRG